MNSTLFFFFCTSYCFLHILLFFAHLIVLHFFYFIAHFTLISLFFTIYMPLCYVTLYNLYSYYFALSTERTWFDYISLLIIPCITYYATNKETLNLEWTLLWESMWVEMTLSINQSHFRNVKEAFVILRWEFFENKFTFQMTTCALFQFLNYKETYENLIYSYNIHIYSHIQGWC